MQVCSIGQHLEGILWLWCLTYSIYLPPILGRHHCLTGIYLWIRTPKTGWFFNDSKRIFEDNEAGHRKTLKTVGDVLY